MIRKTLMAVAALAVLVSGPVFAEQCRNPKTKKFITCPKPAVAPVAAGGVIKDKNGKCHVASGKNKGKFTKCP